MKDRCLYIGTRRYNDVVVWAYGYSLSRENGKIRVVNASCEVAAKAGDEVSMGAGQISQGEAGPTPEAARQQFEEKPGELGVPDRCRGPLGVSSGVIKKPEK